MAVFSPTQYGLILCIRTQVGYGLTWNLQIRSYKHREPVVFQVNEQSVVAVQDVVETLIQDWFGPRFPSDLLNEVNFVLQRCPVKILEMLIHAHGSEPTQAQQDCR